MIDGLVSGKVTVKPQKRLGNNNNSFVTIRINAAMQNGDIISVGIISFDNSTCKALLALEVGDSVSLTGALTPKVWTTNEGVTKPSLDMIAHAVLTPYNIKKKRNTMQDASSR